MEKTESDSAGPIIVGGVGVAKLAQCVSQKSGEKAVMQFCRNTSRGLKLELRVFVFPFAILNPVVDSVSHLRVDQPENAYGEVT